MNILNKSLMIFVMFSLTGCIDLAPFYKKPEAPIPASLGQGQADIKSFSELEWKKFIADERLKNIVQLALENNRDLKAAALNIENARTLYQIQTYNLYPSVTGNGSQIAYYGNANTGVSFSGPSNGGSNISNLGASNSSGKITRVYRATIGFSAYELDLFGRIRNLNEQALQTFYANEETKKSTQISLIGEVANAWFTMAADLMRLDIAKKTLESQQATYDINKKSFDLGAIDLLSLTQLQTTVDSAKVAVANYETIVKKDLNALNLLVGASVPEKWLPSAQMDIVTAYAGLPKNVTSDILQQRPDVQAAEHLLKGANANIGAARAAYFPTITLSTSAGYSSASLNGLFNGDGRSNLWTFIPQVSVPIFPIGGIQSRVKSAEQNKEILLARYDKTIQTAFKEVADVLADREGLQAQLASQKSMVAATEQALKLATNRYEGGFDGYLTVLDAQRAHYNAQQTLVALQLSEATSQLTLYKVLGGGWH